MELDFLSHEYFNNSVQDYLCFGLIIILGLILARPIISYLLRIALKLFGSSSSESEKEILDSLLKKPLHYFCLLMILYVSLNTLSLPQKWVGFIETHGIKSDFYADNMLKFGGAYLSNENLQFDTSLVFNFKNTPKIFYINFGGSYRFDLHKDKE